jgi:tetratricopeptide (TPR) repeat protein
VTCVRGAFCIIAALHSGIPAAAQPAVELDALERDVAALEAELGRLEDTNRKLPELFAVGDRGERATWGAIYHLNREYARASLALFGAVEANTDAEVTSVESTPEYAESLFYLADSLYEMGNVGAARVYFERLLRLRGHAFFDDAIIRLMAIASDDGRYDDVDRYYLDYQATAGKPVPGQVRYLRAKSLFRSERDEGAIEELGQISAGDAFDLRSRYLVTAVLTRQGKLSDALAVAEDAIKRQPVATVDADVLDYLGLARARLLHELDRLDESIDAYQEISLESRHLGTMLYEVSLTYVRRGQLALHVTEGDGLSDASRQQKADFEYRKALRQLDDLRSLDPNSDRVVDIDLLAGNLILQLHDFDTAHDRFADVVGRFSAADRELERLAHDGAVREQILRDILALEKDPRAALESPLPALAARRTARNQDVARSLHVFKEINKTQAEVDEADRLLEQLEGMLSPANPSLTEVFGALQPAVGKSQSLANASSVLRARLLAIERGMVRPSAEQREHLSTIAEQRAALESRIQSLPQTSDAVEERRKTFQRGVEAVERSLHELELANSRLRASAVATGWLAERELSSPAQRERAKAAALELAQETSANDARIGEIHRAAEAVRQLVQTAGGRGSGDELLRARWSSLANDEHVVLQKSRGPGSAPLSVRIDSVYDKISGLVARNDAFRIRLDASVEQNLVGVRSILATERASLTDYQIKLNGIDSLATGLRSAATGVALERVRQDVAAIVLRADVGIIDTAFARKQSETDQINGLQRARAVELTDLTQAYADLTRDESP